MLKRLLFATFFVLCLTGVAYGQRDNAAWDSRAEQEQERRVAARERESSRIRTKADAQADLNAAEKDKRRERRTGDLDAWARAVSRGVDATEELRGQEKYMPGDASTIRGSIRESRGPSRGGKP